MIDGQVTVNDTNGQNFTFTATGTRTYNQRFPCPTAAGAHTIVHENTATIHSTGQAANAPATIHCATPTNLTNNLSEGTIYPGQSATDQATITGANMNAGGTITYKVYTDPGCTTQYADATPSINAVTGASAPPSNPITFDTRGTYYWQATYSGDPDTNTLDATSSCTPLTVKGWQTGDLTTYTQNSWTTTPGSTTLSSNFNSIYTGGSVEVGGHFTMDFTTANHVVAYIPAGGIPAALTGNLVDPTSSPSGAFGGDVLALQLDVDFSDAGLLPATSGQKFGDLTLCNFPAVTGDDLSAANGMTVRQLLAAANTALGGGTQVLNINELDWLASSLNSAFDNGTPSSFAQTNLVNGPCS